MADATVTPGPTPRPHRLRQWVLTVLVGLLCFTLILAGWAYRQWSTQPAWYQEVQSRIEKQPKDQRQYLASRAQITIANAYLGNEIDPDTGRPYRPTRLVDDLTPARIDIPIDALNAWFIESFDAWRENQGHRWPIPEYLDDFRISVHGDQLYLGFHIRTEAIDQIITIVFAHAPRKDELGRYRVARVYAGRLRLPTAVVGSYIQDLVDEDDAQGLSALLAALQGEPFEIRFDAEHNRAIEILVVELGETVVSFTYQFQRRDPTSLVESRPGSLESP